jgi:hypothetical protein
MANGIKIGNGTMTQIFKGSSAVSAVYQGTNLIYPIPLNWWFIGNANNCLNPAGTAMVVRYQNSGGTFVDVTLQNSSNNGYIMVVGRASYTPTRVSGLSAAYFDLRNLGSYNPTGSYTFYPQLTNISTTRTITYIDTSGNNQTITLNPSFTNTVFTARQILTWQGGICDS